MSAPGLTVTIRHTHADGSNDDDITYELPGGAAWLALRETFEPGAYEVAGFASTLGGWRYAR